MVQSKKGREKEGHSAHMNILGIKYFLAIADERSISAAARKLYISQQSLSEHLKKLETEMGTPLFKRGKELELTIAGQCFLEGGKEVMNAYNRMLQNVEDVTQKRRSSISVAVPTSSAPPYFTTVLISYLSKYPEYKVDVVKRQQADITHNMAGVDLYLGGNPLPAGLSNYVILESDPYCVAFQRCLAQEVFGERWPEIDAKLKQTGDLSLVKEMPMLVLRDRYSQINEDLRLILDEYHFMPNIALNSENSEVNREYCLAGKGCLIAPESMINHYFFFDQDEATKTMLSYPIRVKSFETKMAISYEKGRHLHAAEIGFINEVVEYFKKY